MIQWIKWIFSPFGIKTATFLVGSSITAGLITGLIYISQTYTKEATIPFLILFIVLAILAIIIGVTTIFSIFVDSDDIYNLYDNINDTLCSIMRNIGDWWDKRPSNKGINNGK